MAQNKLQNAIDVYGTFCRVLDKHNWNYQKNEEKLSIDFGARGDDLLMDFKVRVDAQRELVMLVSHMPFVVAEDKRLELAVAISAINNLLVDGCFDYDLMSGNIFFRMTCSYIGSSLSRDVFDYMLFCACDTIDNYNDKLLLIAKGMTTLEQFLLDIKT